MPYIPMLRFFQCNMCCTLLHTHAYQVACTHRYSCMYSSYAQTLEASPQYILPQIYCRFVVLCLHYAFFIINQYYSVRHIHCMRFLAGFFLDTEQATLCSLTIQFLTATKLGDAAIESPLASGVQSAIF